MKKFKIFYNFLLHINIIKFVLINVITLLSIQLIITSLPFAESINTTETLDLKEVNPILLFFFVVLVAPLFETIIFQTAIIKLVIYLQKIIKIKQNNYLPITISAIAFGLYHNYNTTYIIIGIIGGFVFASSYIISKKRSEKPIINLFLIHSVLNFIPFCIDFF